MVFFLLSHAHIPDISVALHQRRRLLAYHFIHESVSPVRFTFGSSFIVHTDRTYPIDTPGRRMHGPARNALRTGILGRAQITKRPGPAIRFNLHRSVCPGKRSSRREARDHPLELGERTGAGLRLRLPIRDYLAAIHPSRADVTIHDSRNLVLTAGPLPDHPNDPSGGAEH